MNPLNEVLTLSEAAHQRHITPNAIRLKLNRLAKEGKIKPTDARKVDSPKGEWLLTCKFMDILYEPQK